MHAYYALINDEPFTDGLADADAFAAPSAILTAPNVLTL
jgi:hypothetical protein